MVQRAPAQLRGARLLDAIAFIDKGLSAVALGWHCHGIGTGSFGETDDTCWFDPRIERSPVINQTEAKLGLPLRRLITERSGMVGRAGFSAPPGSSVSLGARKFRNLQDSKSL
jgi:hypothetical protein